MKTLPLVLGILPPLPASAGWKSDSTDVPSNSNWGIMAGNTGISFGNGQDMTGIRFAWRDGAFIRVNGIQIGVLNHVESNPAWTRWLPVINARF